MRFLHAGDGDVGGSTSGRDARPTEAEVRHYLEGNICRCTGYHNIVKAVWRRLASRFRRNRGIRCRRITDWRSTKRREDIAF